jgi:hypothetical protein
MESDPKSRLQKSPEQAVSKQVGKNRAFAETILFV